jgi:branched-chain amino acid transport system substrate-binding protein
LTLTRQHGRPAGTAVSTVVQPRCRGAARRRPALRRALVGLCLAAATATSGCSPPWAAGGSTNGDIPIGLIQALSGAAASIGIPATEIARREVDHVNATGGISGRKLRLVVADDRSDPNEAVRVTRNLIAQDHVAAIVGSTTGTSTLALLPVAAQQKTPVFSPNGTAALADPKSPYFPWLYLFAPMDSLSAPRQFSAATGAARRVAVFYQEDAYGRYGAELFDELARQSGKEIVASTSAPLTGADLSAQITKIKSAAPDVVLMQTSITGVSAQFVKTARQVGLQVPIYGSAGLQQSAFLSGAGPAADGLDLVGFFDPSHPAPVQQELAARLGATGYQPKGDFYEVIYPSGIQVVAAAARAAGQEINGDSLKKAVDAGLDVPGYYRTPMRFGRDNHVGVTAGALVTLTARNGAFVSGQQ